jgi:predicted NAD/FAD-binding protein
LRESVFDQVVFASHSDQTLKMIQDATPLETEILSSFQYQTNETVLHTDTRVLPARKLAWAAWNYFVPKSKGKKVSVSYDMNILQGLEEPETYCVSLNLEGQIQPKKVIRTLHYDHPVYSARAFAAQSRHSEINGKNLYHFAGAYWGYGFHEDGVKSALAACAPLGGTWKH